MKTSRRSIARAMVLIAILAVDFAAFRVAFVAQEVPDLFGESTTAYEMALMFGPSCLVAQVGLFRAVFGRPGLRPFWIALTVSATAIVLVLARAVLVGLPPVTGLWMTYYGGWERTAALAGFDVTTDRFILGHFTVGGLLLALYLFVPQFLISPLRGRDRLPGREMPGGPSARTDRGPRRLSSPRDARDRPVPAIGPAG